MLSKVPQEFHKFTHQCNVLKRILNDTQRSLEDINCSNLFPGEDLKELLLGQDVCKSIYKILDLAPTILIFGQTCYAKALFINFILDQVLLPLHVSSWRWVRISHGQNKKIHLTLENDYELVGELKANREPWYTVPEEDLQRLECETPLDQCPSLEIEINHEFLKENLQIVVPPDCHYDILHNLLEKSMEKMLPVILYIIEGILTEENIYEIKQIKEIFHDLPILFIHISGKYKSSSVVTQMENHLSKVSNNIEQYPVSSDYAEFICNQLKSLGYVHSDCYENIDNMFNKNSCFGECVIDNSFISDENDINDQFFIFVQGCLKACLLKMAALLSKIHNKCLQKFILSAFDMAREIQITPRRIEYAQAREAELYRTLMNVTNEKQDEITAIIQTTLQDMRNNVTDIIQDYRQDISQNICSSEIQQILLRKLCKSVATQLVQSVDCLQENFTGTLQRCLESLEKICNDKEINLMASVAVKHILSAAYNIDVKFSTSFSIIRTFWDRLRNILYSIQLPWNSYAHHDPLYRRKLVALEIIDSLCASKIANSISAQFKEHVKTCHEAFQTSMRILESHVSGKLEQTEQQRITIRKYYAPRFAKLALESTSMCDIVRWGLPKQNKEIGRGQYGVVFACEPWAGIDPCAVKSVVPPDERHWNDLAMEFYYTRTIPEHCRIVRLRGSIIDLSYGSGCAAVLLVMERMNRDLYCGLNAGLSWHKRLQIAIDVVVGIRYLHSQGLVHRDIKLKNVLLDGNDRAKLTDFGFCIPEAMMSGSVVGTPVHMAPELLSGHYDSSVDVYAFGILFWYICAGHVRLPCVFEHFQNKEQLWCSVRKGIRPECLPQFDEACWNLMEQCWTADPASRPLLGDVQPKLETIMKSSCKKN